MREIAFCLTLMLLLSACEGPPERTAAVDSLAAQETDTSTAFDTSVVADTSASQAEAVGSHGNGDWTTEIVSKDNDRSGVATLEDIRIASHADFDRIVFEFRDEILPGYKVEYAEEEIIECGSGEAFDLAGLVPVSIRMTPVRGYNDEGKSTVNHAKRSPNLSAVKEAWITCDFEAMFTLVAGISARTPYRVQTFHDPARLVVDVRRPEP